MAVVKDISGEWRVALDRGNLGIRERWFSKILQGRIQLPGTTDEAGLGDVTEEACWDRLSRVVRWIGPVWYQKTVNIPRHWKDKRVFLTLERTKDSQVWVDNRWAGSDDTLSTAQTFELTRLLTPGKHTITVLVDNAKLPPIGPCHQVDERTQTNWNGILGRIELSATDKVCVDTVEAYPDAENRTVRVVSTIGKAIAGTASVDVRVSADVPGNSEAPRIKGRRLEVRARGASTTVECELQIPDSISCWDEFDPTLLRVTIKTRAEVKDQVMRDNASATFGMRTFSANKGQFVINGRPLFLRGKNDCALFPITGYAPMTKEYWLWHLGVAASYGVNHYRFHSWCPPEAAFAAADELGIYFQVELPNKRGITEPDNRDYTPPKEAYETLDELKGDGGEPAARTAYLTREGERMLKAYGNHPSFVMMTLGNEIGGDIAVMKDMCDHFRSLDDRHLYAMGTNLFGWDLKFREGSEFWVTKGTRPGQHVRGASWDARCHIDHRAPSTTVNFEDKLRGMPVPIVGHENAQYEVYPDFSEIKKYTGVLRPRNLEIVRDGLEAAGMLDQASDFQRASGAISLICHREDVEAALRTKGFGGFQMLDLQDFSGQGTALVGMLDVFMDSKGLVTPEQWSEFCCETVPLLWMTKYTWTNAETFSAGIRVAHYGPDDLENTSLTWQLNAGSVTIARGETRSVTVFTGTVTEIDLINASLAGIKKAQKLTLVLQITGTSYTNRYDIWVYPAKVNTTAPKRVTVARSFSRKVQRALDDGETVLLFPKPEKIKQSVASAFQSGFWSPMFRLPDREPPLGIETPGTQGILCDPSHPVFEGFPTEFHSNWQWWHLVKNSRSVILDATPADYRPVIQMIDGIDRNHKLGLLFEVSVGKGKLMVCSMDLPSLQDHPEARQFLASLQRYVASRNFRPAFKWSAEEIRKVL